MLELTSDAPTNVGKHVYQTVYVLGKIQKIQYSDWPK